LLLPQLALQSALQVWGDSVGPHVRSPQTSRTGAPAPSRSARPQPPPSAVSATAMAASTPRTHPESLIMDRTPPLTKQTPHQCHAHCRIARTMPPRPLSSGFPACASSRCKCELAQRRARPPCDRRDERGAAGVGGSWNRRDGRPKAEAQVEEGRLEQEQSDCAKRALNGRIANRVDATLPQRVKD
jgi:hypothetical protein